MMPAPVAGVTFSAKRDVTKLLSERGATIEELNTVRKHLSTVKGGRLAQECNAGLLISLILSDVVGDRLDSIASGPTAPDPTTFMDALSVLNKPEISDLIPHEVMDHIARGVRGEIVDTPSHLPTSVVNLVIGNNATALEKAEMSARKLGYNILNLGSYMEGEAREVGTSLVSLARSIKRDGKPIPPPACILWGGETTVSNVAPRGKGGRNQELVVAAIDHAFDEGMQGIMLFSASTDGEDGPTDAAGGFADEGVVNSCKALGLHPRRFLDRSDSYRFLNRVGGHYKSGPTGTNVMDITLALVT
jgi:glycerate-2-kinase